MLKLAILARTQAVLMCGAQSFCKVASDRMGSFSFSWAFFRDSVFANGPLFIAGVLAIAAIVEWAYMLKNYPFSVVYPLSSLSFILAMFVAIIFFHENVVWAQWIGVFLILGGCFLIAR